MPFRSEFDWIAPSNRKPAPEPVEARTDQGSDQQASGETAPAAEPMSLTEMIYHELFG